MVKLVDGSHREETGREERGEIVVGMQNKGINLINSYIHPKKEMISLCSSA